MDIKKLPSQGPEDLKKVSEIETKYQSIREEITVLNNTYINRMHDFYKADGLPSVLVKGGKAVQLKALRDQMFKTAKNVKEGYKGFAIDP